MTASENQTIGEIFNVERESCVIDWKIKKIFLRQFNGSWLSPKFSFSGVTWHLSIRGTPYNEQQRLHTFHSLFHTPNIRGNSMSAWGNEEVSLYLHKDESAILISDFFCYLGINSNQTHCDNPNSFGFSTIPIFLPHSEHLVKCKFNRSESRSGPFRINLHEISQSSQFPPDVTVSCVIFIPDKLKTDTAAQLNSAEQSSTSDDLSPLGRDLKELFLSGEGADVTIKLKDKKINAHSQILAARSPVFAPMFTCDMKEKNTGEVDIKEFEPEAFREFIIFLYCGETENMSEDNVIDLYCAADKYDVKELKTKCRNFMKKDMSVGIFCDVLSLAIRYTDTELINHSRDFFTINVKKILASAEWITFAKQYPIESNELVLGVVNKFVPGGK